jgi:hypothetical protein
LRNGFCYAVHTENGASPCMTRKAPHAGALPDLLKRRAPRYVECEKACLLAP